MNQHNANHGPSLPWHPVPTSHELRVLERTVVAALVDAGIPVGVVAPARPALRPVAGPTGQDRPSRRPRPGRVRRQAPPRTPSDAETRLNHKLVDHRRQLIAIRVAETNRLKGRPSLTIRANLAYLDSPIDAWVAAMAGLAPVARDSVKHRGARTIFGGRADVCSALYMPAVSAARFNPELKTFFFRLRTAGKAAKSARTAVARKLQAVANAMVRDMEPWRRTNPTTAA